jgi:UMF1 family MFS transporter
MSAAAPSPAPPAVQLPVRKREIFGWAMFDFANSSYTTTIITVAFSVYFRQLLVGGPRGDWLWGVAMAISNVLVLLTAPLVGAVADSSGLKKRFLAVTWITCVVTTAALYFAVPGQLVLAIGLFVISNLAYALGEPLVAAFLPEISTPKNVGRISGFGWGLGYFGGLACLLLIRPLMAGGFVEESIPDLRWIGPITAAFFFVAALPTFLFLRDRTARDRVPGEGGIAHLAATGGRRLAGTFRSLRHFRELARFLVVYFVYSCGLMTVIAFAAIYAGSTIGFTGDELIVLFLVLQIASAAGALLGGPLQDRIGSRGALRWILLLWIAVCIGSGAAQTKAAFWVAALGAGAGIGALMATSRGIVSLLSPTDKSGEIFGFWGLATRAAYALGPLIFGSISAATGSQRIAVWVTSTFFVLGWLGLGRVDIEAGRRAAESWAGAANG